MSFRLAPYLQRVGLSTPLEPSVKALRRLQVAHLEQIPFENIDVRLGRPIRLDLESLQSKLVDRRRGGYCFEHNTLFAAGLRAIGFGVTTLEARVRPRSLDVSRATPRTHMCLRVDIDDHAHLADVGFGGDGPLWPVPLDGSVDHQPDGRVRVRREADQTCVLQRQADGAWIDLYAFTLEPALPIDYEVANYYTSTHPGSRFVRTLTAQRSTEKVRHILRDRTYAVQADSHTTTAELGVDAIAGLLRGTFGLEVSDDEVRRALDGEDSK